MGTKVYLPQFKAVVFDSVDGTSSCVLATEKATNIDV